jgi:hypothetical protein
VLELIAAQAAADEKQWLCILDIDLQSEPGGLARVVATASLNASTFRPQRLGRRRIPFVLVRPGASLPWLPLLPCDVP